MAWKIAYILTRFPKISESFIVDEILELQRLGLQIEIFPLVYQQPSVPVAGAEKLSERTHYANAFTRAVWASQLHWLRMAPLTYLKAWWRALVGNIGSVGFFARSPVVVLLAAHFAHSIQKLGIPHVHAHQATHPALAAYVIQLLTGVSYSITAHANDIYVERSMLHEKIRAAKFIVTTSEYNREYLSDLFGDVAENKTYVIRSGVDPSYFHPAKGRKHEVQFNILCIASFRERKGHVHLIDACAQLKKFDIPFRCKLVGDGAKRAFIEAQIRRNRLSDSVQCLGWQPRERVKELLAEADVMVLPCTISRNGKTEEIPLALLEAGAMEVPVVSTSISGIPELVEHGKTGLLVSDRNPEALAKALIRLYENPYLSVRLAKAAREKVVRQFNLHRNVPHLFNLLSDRFRTPTKLSLGEGARILENREKTLRETSLTNQ